MEKENGYNNNKYSLETKLVLQQAKEKAVKMLQQAASPINRKLEVGDFILYTWLQCHESLNDILRNSCFITAEAFISTHDYMRKFCKHLLEEIKSHVRTTEQI